MKVKLIDSEGILRCIEGTEEFVKEQIRKYKPEKKKSRISIIKKEIEEEEDDSSTRRMDRKV